MKLLPQSLFGRLMVIMVIGLLLAQVISAMILLRDRDQSLRQNLGLNMIQRVAAIVNLLEETPPERRSSVINAFDSPDFRVYLSKQSSGSTTSSMSTRHLQMMLGRNLPDHPMIRINQAPPAMKGMGQGGGPHRRMGQGRRMMPGGFQTQVQLKDGQWLNFRHRLPAEFSGWPDKLMTYLLVLLISIIAISLIAVRQVTRPFGHLAEAADRLGRDIQSPPLAERGATEVRRAAAAFNTMQQRLQRYIKDRSEILAAVSHDLKTPITRLRLRAEMLDDREMSDKFSHDLDAMEQMVMATLDFMRGTESSEKTVPVDILALIESLQDDMQELGGEVTIEAAELAPFTGRPLALKRCLSNLIENAIRYGERAHVQFEEQAGSLIITVCDDGPGVPDEELERLFRPFYRLEESRSRDTGGTGLGLGIARNIARAHGGDLVLRNRSPQGLEATLTLPRI